MMRIQLTSSNFAVAFIDLLGQREAMKPHRLLPSDLKEQHKLLRNTVVPILRMHQRFERFYERAVSAPSIYQSLTPEQRKTFAWAAPAELHTQRFSDGLVVYCSLGEKEGPIPISSVHSLISAAACLCMNQLAARRPVRIGLDVGWGVETQPNELYGSAIAQAYELESKIAQWPRVVVGQELIGYLNWSATHHGDAPQEVYRREAAAICLSCLIKDTDGSTIVDYAGPQFIFESQTALLKKVINRARQFASEQVSEWSEKGNPTICGRYQCLVDYLARRESREALLDGQSRPDPSKSNT